MHIIVDGYNLIRASADLKRHERIGLEEGRRALIAFLTPYRLQSGHRITIVFDGWKDGAPALERDRSGGMTILYSPRGVTADQVIRELVLKGSEEIIVVTSDRQVATFAERHGATAIPSEEFETLVIARISKAPIPKMKDEGDEDEGDRGAKKKGPARRLSRAERRYRRRVAKL